MVEFEKWWEREQNNDVNDLDLSRTAWKAALEWVKDKLKCEVCPGDVEYFIDKEITE